MSDIALALHLLWRAIPLWVGLLLIPVAMAVGALMRAAVCS